MEVLKKISSAADFQLLERSKSLAVVHFEADWAPQCKQVNEVLAELNGVAEVRSGGTQFYTLPAEELPEISHKYNVEAVPTVLLIKNSKEIDRVDGVNIPQLTAKVKSHSCGTTVAAEEPLEERLKKLISRHNIMVFMKGDRNMPRCGFSKTLINILQGVGVEYDTFDILGDEEVRQGLKKFSDWPTYPQVYVKGELIGGLDIVKEMQSAGELETALRS